MLSYQAEDPSEIHDEAQKLLERAWAEVGTVDQDGLLIPLELSWDRVILLAGSGLLHVITARDAKRLVGYAVYVIGPSMIHHSTVAEALAVWLMPEYRKGAAGRTLLDVAEVAMRALGADILVTRTTQRRDFGPVLRRAGYRHVESVYMKELNQ